MPIDYGFRLFKPDFKADDIELIIAKDAPSKFKDILVANNEYEVL